MTPIILVSDSKSNAKISYSAKIPAMRLTPWIIPATIFALSNPLRVQYPILLSSAPSSQLILYPSHQQCWRHLRKTDDSSVMTSLMMTSPTLYPQAITFKCIKYAKCFYFSRTGPLSRSTRSKLSPNFFLLPENLYPKSDQKKVFWHSFDFLTISFASY